MRLLCISLEFSAATFSGNGIYCQSQVRALSRLGHEVLVLCGKPQNYSEPQRLEGAVVLLEVELPVWGRLDAGCAWQEFAAAASAPHVASAVAPFAPQAVLGVDWHSLAAYDALAEALPGAATAAAAPLAPFIFMNYRVHLRTAAGEDAALLSRLERAALERSACTTVLSRSDAQYLSEAFPDVANSRALHVLLPALRSDMANLPLPVDTAQHKQQQTSTAPCDGSSGVGLPQEQGCGAAGATQAAAAGVAAERPQQNNSAAVSAQPVADFRGVIDPGRGRYMLTCAVRVSPEKEPDRFLGLAVELARRGALARGGVVPLMFGAGWGSEYGQQLRARVQRELPECMVLDKFMGPAELAAIYSATLLNVHPCQYDAYGMTVVEAASQGTPSLVNQGGHVGATDLLEEASGEVICMDLSRPAAELAAEVEALLQNPAALRGVGAAAAHKARSWTEEANAATLVGLVQEALQGCAG